MRHFEKIATIAAWISGIVLAVIGISDFVVWRFLGGI